VESTQASKADDRKQATHPDLPAGEAEEQLHRVVIVQHCGDEPWAISVGAEGHILILHHLHKWGHTYMQASMSSASRHQRKQRKPVSFPIFTLSKNRLVSLPLLMALPDDLAAIDRGCLVATCYSHGAGERRAITSRLDGRRTKSGKRPAQARSAGARSSALSMHGTQLRL
jgi:hypothetical protein